MQARQQSPEAAELSRILKEMLKLLDTDDEILVREVGVLIDSAYEQAVPELEIDEGAISSEVENERLGALTLRVREKYATLVVIANNPERIVPSRSGEQAQEQVKPAIERMLVTINRRRWS